MLVPHDRMDGIYHFMCHKFFEMILHDLNLDAVVLNSANLFKEGNSEIYYDEVIHLGYKEICS